MVVALAAGLALGLPGCSRTAPAPRPNVLLIVVDALRADHLGAYGYARPTSPVFDAMANRATLFTRAHSTTSWTNPAVESLFTGEHPRILEPGAAQFILPNTRTLAAAFRDAGYRTGAIIANPVLPPDLGLAQGFETYLPVSGWVHGWSQRPKESAEAVNDAATGWLRETSQPARPWLLYLHYMDTHWPYTPPAAEAQRFWRSTNADVQPAMPVVNERVGRRQGALSPDEARQAADLYDAAIAHFDAQLGQLIAAMETAGQLANTTICITADHGEELGDHGGVQHARTLYEEVLHIPLLVISPRAVRGERVDRLVQLTDVGRTLLDLAGLSAVDFPGRSLLGRNQKTAPADSVFAELRPGFLTGALHQYALLQGTLKLIVTADQRSLLFDLGQDPAEQHEQPASQSPLPHQLQARLAALANTRPQQPVNTPDAVTRERLRALGYEF
jgi:arylsulfatase A-like enzyme